MNNNHGPDKDMPNSQTERHLRRLLCIQRHGTRAYMDDGEASFPGDEYCRSIDYMRETPQAIEQALREAGIKKFDAETSAVKNSSLKNTGLAYTIS